MDGMKMHPPAGRVTGACEAPEAGTVSEVGPIYDGPLTPPTCRERLIQDGPEALRDSELLAVALGSSEDEAREIVERFDFGELVNLSVEKLADLRGVTSARAARLLAAVEIARRALDRGMGILPVITTPTETIPMLADIKDEQREYFVCLYLNARNQVIHKEVVSIGSLSASIVHPREVFRVGVAKCAASVILAHNHPSGDVSPSKDDIDLTHRLREAGLIMGIEVLDHIIIATADFVSLKETGIV